MKQHVVDYMSRERKASVTWWVSTTVQGLFNWPRMWRLKNRWTIYTFRSVSFFCDVLAYKEDFTLIHFEINYEIWFDYKMLKKNTCHDVLDRSIIK